VAQSVSASERLRLRVRRLLAASHHHQTDLGQALGISQSEVSRRLRGKLRFRLKELDAIAAFFHITVPELFFDEYGRFDRRKATRRSGQDRRKVNLFSLREDPQPWHSPARIRTPPAKPKD
jgi:transcriptional regulator with XRE-family HTH domain